ncbi:MAG: hypothetical protein EWV75_20205 [Microcystis wesenbergii Mw_QC_S_20081001_S30D]|jgi:hypothetical protein|uniref:Uncharacterized protein n=1 Tax=Microcystis wesenbergii Mw_QC_S_20081001_S30D TaxID=2486245 RepID=A0A552JA04_9CHRO|nr:MAG: hypothetical protein EWV75_20205 [Microcystis wesenbergii Mw_QC_S_20081001_S30D]TRU96110.1 MAG: hypothetical protein EWV74_19370 [Microcystis wesenbergii Mw_QC_S_20081001_S30]TRV02879.1 MAG: hypothetical protein EWV73_06200 [Microcystis wesenbergii Mw_QC_B_20070930_S4D]TRV15760.1 MAG: hypothetical protein EWV89_06755 [Microcystis wesenbergii Mw_QC_B_20070930_S4]
MLQVVPVTSYQLPVISYQLSVTSYQESGVRSLRVSPGATVGTAKHESGTFPSYTPHPTPYTPLPHFPTPH